MKRSCLFFRSMCRASKQASKQARGVISWMGTGQNQVFLFVCLKFYNLCQDFLCHIAKKKNVEKCFDLMYFLCVARAKTSSYNLFYIFFPLNLFLFSVPVQLFPKCWEKKHRIRNNEKVQLNCANRVMSACKEFFVKREKKQQKYNQTSHIHSKRWAYRFQHSAWQILK